MRISISLLNLSTELSFFIVSFCTLYQINIRMHCVKMFIFREFHENNKHLTMSTDDVQVERSSRLSFESDMHTHTYMFMFHCLNNRKTYLADLPYSTCTLPL